MQERREQLRAGHLSIVDVDMYAEGILAITLGTRGVASLNVTVVNSCFDLHSGMYGGIVLSPAKTLIQALAMLWGGSGRVAIPEFYKNILSLSREEKGGLDWEGDFQNEAALLGIKVCQSEEGFSFLESNWIRPNLEINGIESGYTGKGFKTIIPSKAMLKLSCRLVPRQDPSHILSLIETFFKKNLPKEMEISFERGSQALAVKTSPRSETARCVAKAYKRVYKTRCLRKLCGGSIPIAPSLSKVSGAEPVMMGVSLAEDQVHASNEYFSFDRLKEGFLSITQLLEIFANGEKNALEGSCF